MKYLIVNGDDFGASRGINRGMLEAHWRGILTSASLMVNRLAAEEAAMLGRMAPELSVGLHFELAGTAGNCLVELSSQLARFEQLMERPPTHLDSHHNVHRNPALLPCFLEMAWEHGLPLREHSPVRYFSKFYGQSGRETHLEQISPESLTRMLQSEIEDGITELSCHPDMSRRIIHPATPPNAKPNCEPCATRACATCSWSSRFNSSAIMI